MRPFGIVSDKGLKDLVQLCLDLSISLNGSCLIIYYIGMSRIGLNRISDRIGSNTN
jgi:hypothetical protein